MCGIAGYFGSAPVDPQAVQSTLTLMRNRGPDHQDSAVFFHQNKHVALLHSRLGIIDLDERSNQPFHLGPCTLVFNGEIYNYLELRRELIHRGITLQTQSDTEVLLHYYLLHGQTCVDHFEGMWSFAIYDRRKGTLFLSRDRFAEKPLYYCQTHDGFYFASESKFISSLSDQSLSINHRQLRRYLVNGYKSLYKHEETFFDNLRELPYATNAVVGPDLKVRSHQYWIPQSAISPMTMDDAVQGVREAFMESLKLRLRSDVPVAFCLSGGIDSSAIVSAAAKHFGSDVATFSIVDDDPRYDESDNINATIDDLDCEHVIVPLSTEDDFFDRLQRLVAYHDAPLATISYYVHAFLSEAIADHGYRVAFSGTGADEIFTGYYDHFNLHLYEMRDHPEYDRYRQDWQRHIQPIVRNPYLANPDLYIQDPSSRAHVFMHSDVFADCLRADFDEPFTEGTFCDSLLRNRMMNEMFHEGTRVILHEDDLNSMMNSVENRSPYLDSRLFTFCHSIPPEHLIYDGYGKYVFRRAMQGILNDQVRLDRKKKGFNASLNSVVNLNDPRNRDYLLAPSPIFDILDRDKIEPLLSINPLPNSYSKFLFNVINAKMFLEHHVRELICV
jgi:asparagine synthase (glutamine-hydrolysing)